MFPAPADSPRTAVNTSKPLVCDFGLTVEVPPGSASGQTTSPKSFEKLLDTVNSLPLNGKKEGGIQNWNWTEDLLLMVLRGHQKTGPERKEAGNPSGTSPLPRRFLKVEATLHIPPHSSSSDLGSVQELKLVS